MSLTTGEMSAADLAAVVGNKNDGFGFGGDGAWWLILLFLVLGGGWGNGFGGYGGGFGNMYEFPWLFNGQQEINNNTNNGFRDQMLNNSITGVRDGISALSTQLCNCCGDMQMAVANGFSNAEIAANGRQMANMNQNFALQNAINQGFNGTQAQLAQCCCDNRMATADLKYTIATEACANRSTSTANTQMILDKLCQLELDNYKTQLDNKNDTIAQLRQEVLYARGQASQDVQTAAIRAGQATTANQLVNELRSCPIPSMPVYGQTPIFTCNNGCNGGCGCGCNG